MDRDKLIRIPIWIPAGMKREIERLVIKRRTKSTSAFLRRAGQELLDKINGGK